MTVSTMSAVAAMNHKAETFHGVGRNELAYKLVSKMGWAEGQGLGKDNNGITKHLWTKKRGDAVGLGAEASNDWGAHSIQTNSYNSLLAKLDVIVNNDSDAADSASSSEDEAEARKDKKAAKKKESEKNRKKSKAAAAKAKKSKKSDTSEESSSDSDDSDVESKAASSSTDDHAARKAGRSYAAAAVMSQRYAYKRAFLKKTKDVKSYSSSDLSQILGYSVPPSQDDQSLIAKDSIAQYSKVADSKEGKEDKGKKSKKPRKSKKSGSSSGSESDGSDSEPKPVVMKGEAARRPALPLPPPSVLKGVLVNMFEHGGFLGSKIEVKEQDWVFDEATQEKIAVDAHASKVQSKQGLGFGNDKPSKLGKDFFGEKKKFDSDGEEDEADAGKRKSKDDSEDSDDDATAKKKARKQARKAEKKAEKKAAKDAKKNEADSDGEEDDEASSKKKSKKEKKRKADDDEKDTGKNTGKKKKIKHAKSFVEPGEESEEWDEKKKKKLKKTKSFP